MFNIEENLKKLPDAPGVYIHKDKLGQVIYVGKAVSLKNRVRQYFRLNKNADQKVRAMVSHIEEFEYITCATEMEALILECNLIKKYMPKYNVLLRDDKTYPYIKITLKEQYPRVLKTRLIENDGSKYFGPYSDAKAVNAIVELMNDIYSLKRCGAKGFPRDWKPCLNRHIEKCRGVCTGEADIVQYRADIDRVIEFLNGRRKPVLDILKENMLKCAEALDFEGAAKLRDRISAVNAISEMQRVVIPGAGDMDMVLILKGADRQYGVIFYVREGKLSGRESFTMQSEGGENNPFLAAQFIKQYYSEAVTVPREILVEKQLPEQELIEGYLSQLAGRSVRITVPQRGDKRALIELAQRDIREMAKTIDDRAKAARERGETLRAEIQEALKELGVASADNGGRAYRAEAYDISNTNGVDSVGAMAVFSGASPVKKDYRRFKVKTVEGPDDYGSLQEVIYRRFKRAQEGDPGFSVLPDYILIDGGKGQVSAVCKVLSAMGIEIPVIGMAKDNHHRTRALVSQSGTEIELSERPMLFKYIGSVQEEVHRFAIEYHRGLRNKKMTESVLEQIPGIGPAKRKALLTRFGSVEAVKKASVEELKEAQGISSANAEKIKEYFN